MNGRWPAIVGVGGVLLVAALGFLSGGMAAVRATGAPATGGGPDPQADQARSALAPARAGSTPVPVPPSGRVFFGVQLAWDFDTPAAYMSRLGRKPAVYGDYFRFPLDQRERRRVAYEARRAVLEGAMLMLTLEPTQGLGTVNATTSRELAEELAKVNQAGTPVIVRFAHEMNGSWYPWGQQPARYRRAFRILAAAVHRVAPGSAMMWAPSYGGGYPFRGGAYLAKRGTRVFADMDTNHDGRLGMDDDPYRPFYPGDDAVDWAGLTLYHWGNTWPWGENEISEPGRFRRAIEGTYDGLLGDERDLPDFYHAYAVNRHKPFAIAETGAFYNVNKAAQNANTALAVKSAWWSQLFSRKTHARFPRLHMILWFERRKAEQGVSVKFNPIDWRVTADRETAAHFGSALPPWLVFANDTRRTPGRTRDERHGGSERHRSGTGSG